jgi:hypothetical protein
MKNNEFARTIELTRKGMVRAIGNYPRSPIIAKYFLDALEGVLYSGLLSNVIKNMTLANISDQKLPRESVAEIRQKYAQELKGAKVALPFRRPTMTARRYETFRASFLQDFPRHLKILELVEKAAHKKKFKIILDRAAKDFLNAGKEETSIEDTFMKTISELQIQKEELAITGRRLTRLVGNALKGALEPSAKHVAMQIASDRPKALVAHRQDMSQFQERLAARWGVPFDLLEGHIGHITELLSIQRHRKVDSKGKAENFRAAAILNLHARALQVANEMLVLLKAGYADGAFARWRTLYELSLIAMYLAKEEDIVSRRYLEHAVVGKLKTAKKIVEFKKAFDFAPTKRDIDVLTKQRESLRSQYGKDFDRDYGWIPREKWTDTKIGLWFIEKQVKLGHISPYYDLACRTLHGGAAGFFRMGLMGHSQGTLQTGPTNFGLADPIQHCALSLTNVTLALLGIDPDFDSLVHMKILVEHSSQIAQASVEVQFKIEEDEKALTRP